MAPHDHHHNSLAEHCSAADYIDQGIDFQHMSCTPQDQNTRQPPHQTRSHYYSGWCCSSKDLAVAMKQLPPSSSSSSSLGGSSPSCVMNRSSVSPAAGPTRGPGRQPEKGRTGTRWWRRASGFAEWISASQAVQRDAASALHSKAAGARSHSSHTRTRSWRDAK
ncbi:hypothetical protein OIU76_029698 [Salix suchowensis]|nr:hypothetical protein OIU76_029698 [Salix suchowensis]